MYVHSAITSFENCHCLAFMSSIISVPSSFQSNFSLRNTSNCKSSAECTADPTLDLANCVVSYGRDSSYEGFKQIQGPFNKPFVLDALEDNTTYYVEAIFNTSSNGVDILYHIRTRFTTGESKV